MAFAERCFEVFMRSIEDYHSEGVVTVCHNPYEPGDLDYRLYEKAWIDLQQWHLEDDIREEGIEARKALEIKRQIDMFNQRRTDAVEQLDDLLVLSCQGIPILENARLNTESLAWALDRLSILALKIYHMRQEAERQDALTWHRERCMGKLRVLEEQRGDLILAINQLREDILAGRRYVKVYRQMKMYNDPALNPVLYGKKK